MNGVARVDRNAARASSEPDAVHLGVAAEHVDVGIRGAQGLGADLRERRLVALALGIDTDLDRDAAVVLHSDRRPFAGPDATGLDIAADPDADAPALGPPQRLALAPPSVVALLHGGIEQSLEIQIVITHRHAVPVDEAAAVWHVLPPDDVATANFDRVDSGFAGDGIQHPVHREDGLHAARPAIRAAAWRVGQDAPAFDAERRDLVVRREVIDRVGRQHHLEMTIGADFLVQDEVQRADAAILVERNLDIVRLPARLVRREHVLEARFAPSHRAAEVACQDGCDDVFRIERALEPEASTDVMRNHAATVLRDAQHLSDLVARGIGHLRGGPDFH